MLMFLFITVVLINSVTAEDLAITGQNDRIYDSGTWDRLIISNSTNIIVRNLNFKTASGTGAPAYIYGSRNITIENCDMDGNVDACSGLEIGGGSSYITVEGCTIHNAADDGVEISGDHIYFYNNTIHDLKGCGTDGGCGPCYNGHSDGFELADLHASEFRGNLVYDINSTSAFFMGNWGAPNCSDIIVENNIFYTPRCGFVIYVHYVDGIKIYNNIFWKGVYGGLAVGEGVTDMDCRNNITQNINFNHSGVTPDPAEHRMDYNSYGRPNEGADVQEHDVFCPDPKFKRIPHAYSSTVYTDVTREDFEIQEGSLVIGAGTGDSLAPDTDIYGNERSGDMDIGPFAVSLAPVHMNSRDPGRPFFRYRVQEDKLVVTNPGTGDYRVAVFNMDGKRMVHKTGTGGACSIGTSSLNSGLFYLEIEGDGYYLLDRMLNIR